MMNAPAAFARVTCVLYQGLTQLVPSVTLMATAGAPVIAISPWNALTSGQKSVTGPPGSGFAAEPGQVALGPPGVVGGSGEGAPGDQGQHQDGGGQETARRITARTATTRTGNARPARTVRASVHTRSRPRAAACSSTATRPASAWCSACHRPKVTGSSSPGTRLPDPLQVHRGLAVQGDGGGHGHGMRPVQGETPGGGG